MATPDPCTGTSAPPNLVEAPNAVPYAYGAMSAYTVIDDPDGHNANGVFYQSPFCHGVNTFVDYCAGDTPNEKTPTDQDVSDVIAGCPFTLYAYLSCRRTTLEAMLTDARKSLAIGEQRGVELNVWAQTLATSASTVVNASSSVDDSLSLTAALSALESAIANCYGGQATIHANRGVSAYAADHRLMEKRAGGAFTPVDSKWAFYAGDPNTGPDGEAAPDGYAWVYATSQVTLRRFEVIAPQDVAHVLSYPTNEPVVIAERTYVPTVECCQFAALVCLPATCS